MSADGAKSRRVWLLGAAVLNIALACLFHFHEEPGAPDVPATSQSSVNTAVNGAVAAKASELPSARAPSHPMHVDTAAVQQIGELRNSDAFDENEHPHPITAEHRAIQRELQLVAALNDALDLSDAPAMRALLAKHASEFPADSNELRDGYALLADCLEDRTEPVLRAAREYYDRERASTLRRYVRRVCLEAAGTD